MKFYILLIILLSFFFSCTKEKNEHEDMSHDHEHMAEQKKDSAAVNTYWCPMDTQIVQSKPGTCPICKMDLEPKPSLTAHDSSEHKDWVYMPANIAVLSTIKSVKPAEKSVSVKIKVQGRVSYDERRFSVVASKISGRVEKLYVKYNYQPIKKGQPLFDIFSHELQTAQQEYQYVRRNDPNADDLIAAAQKKLLLLGMTEDQIRRMNAGNHVHATTTVYSPYTGFVVEKQTQAESFVSSEPMGGSAPMGGSVAMSKDNDKISLREGDYLAKGQAAFTVVNTDVVWAVFEVYGNQLSQIKTGQTIHIYVENTNEMIMGKIDFVEPSYKDESGTTRFRVYLNNKEQHLKIGNLLTGEIEAGNKMGIWVPQSSVYDLGKDKIVFLKRGQAYETRKVTIGLSTDKEAEVIDGISSNDEIAENAQYLIDSESFIKVLK